MPLLKKIVLNENFTAGIWNITETEEELRGDLNRTKPGYLPVDSFKNENRRKQWIACRLLLATLLNDPEAEIIYDEAGKPFIKDCPCPVSVSHSGEFVALAIGRTHAVGIDIEKISDRVERVADRFLNKTELESVGQLDRPEKLTICWGAKESLYKLAGNPDVDFKKDIIIHSFDYLCNRLQTCRSSMTASGCTRDYTIHYEKINEYMLVYTYDKDSTPTK